MTCIVGLEHEGKVYIGGDSAGVSGYSRDIRADEKVFINGHFIMGFTTSFRMGQILRYSFSPPSRGTEEENDMRYLVRDFTKAVRDSFKENGFTPKDSDGGSSDVGGTFLLGYKGKLYTIESDFQVEKVSRNFNACGCGSDIALGSLYSTSDLDLSPEDRITKALDAASYFNAGVCGPYSILAL